MLSSSFSISPILICHRMQYVSIPMKHESSDFYIFDGFRDSGFPKQSSRCLTYIEPTSNGTSESYIGIINNFSQSCSQFSSKFMSRSSNSLTSNLCATRHDKKELSEFRKLIEDKFHQLEAEIEKSASCTLRQTCSKYRSY